MFEWDEAKRLATLGKHGLDFHRMPEIFDGPHVILAAKSDVEARHMIVGPLDGAMVAVIFTFLGEWIRLITARRARTNEIRAYRARYQ